MQLTHFTDLGLRVLMYLTHQKRDSPATISEIAQQFEVSRHHLVKVVHFMGQHQWLATTRGKGGGLALARPLHEYRLGDVIQSLEGVTQMIDCAEPPCALAGRCQLKGMLDQAQQAFFASLNQYTLADMVASPTGEAIVRLVARSVPAAA